MALIDAPARPVDGREARSYRFGGVAPSSTPLATTPNFPEYPSAHACHSTAVVTALDAVFGTDKVPMTLDSRVTLTTRRYDRIQDIVNDVDWARVLVGFHFRHSDLQGSALGENVGRYLATRYFQPTH